MLRRGVGQVRTAPEAHAAEFWARREVRHAGVSQLLAGVAVHALVERFDIEPYTDFSSK